MESSGFLISIGFFVVIVVVDIAVHFAKNLSNEEGHTRSWVNFTSVVALDSHEQGQLQRLPRLDKEWQTANGLG